jgi:NAD(P)-dependent dehydrogenase (short-subunit alcohol dehydrogenase family)
MIARALVVGASGGIGTALAAELSARGAEVTRLSRREGGLDVTDEASVEAALAALEPPFDLIFVATGSLSAGGGPEKSLGVVDADALTVQFRLNAAGPLIVLKHALRLMPRDRRSVFAALSARVGSIGDNQLGGWYGYRAAKAALNQLLRTAAVEVARTHPHAVIAALHPGTVRTPFTEGYVGRHPAVAPAEAAANLLDVIDGLTPAQSGSFHDYAGRIVPW